MGGAASGKLTFKTTTAGTTATVSVSGSGVKQTHTVDLSWHPSTSRVLGYNIYRGTTSGGPYSKLNSRLDVHTRYLDKTVSAGHTYYYVTRAVNSSGRESKHSNQAQAVIP